MSTYWYFECKDHDPPIRSHDEFTQHTDDFYYDRGVQLALNRPVPEEWWDIISLSEYFAHNALRFLSAHPNCNLELVNEYDQRRNLEGFWIDYNIR